MAYFEQKKMLLDTIREIKTSLKSLVRETGASVDSKIIALRNAITAFNRFTRDNDKMSMPKI